MRLDRRLAELNFGTRKTVQGIIRSGAVVVNGNCIRDGSFQTADTDVIAVSGKTVDTRRVRHIMLNKPGNVLTAARDKKQKTVMDLLPPVYQSLGCMPVGRLDKDTTGLLLFTTDGELSHRLLSPQRHVDKTYHVKTDLPLTHEDAAQFREGMDLGDFVAQPSELRLGKANEAWVVIHEGKFHQVKRMFEHVGKTVLELDRVSFGPLSLDPELGRGDWRELTQKEAEALYASAGMEPDHE